MSAARQISAVVGMNVRAMGLRIPACLVIVLGMAAAVAVALAIFSMSVGITEMIRQSVPNPDRMAIVSQGAIDGGPSNIPRAALEILRDTPGLKQDPDGKPIISGTVGAAFITRKKGKEADAFVGVTGVAPSRFYDRPEIKFVEGRMFTPGLRELIAGKAAVDKFEGIALGSEVRLADGPWTIVGIFSGSGTSDYVLWGDSDTVMAAFKRTSYGVVFARLEEGTKEAQEAFKAAVKSNPAVSVEAETELENRMRGVKNNVNFYRFLAYGVGAIMGLGVVVATLNIMYAAVSSRTVEIATLRAIGFGGLPVVLSILIEVLALVVLGALLGAAIAWLIFHGRSQNMGPFSVTEAVTPIMMLVAVAGAFLLGIVAALFPAIHAARLPVARALQGT